MEKRFRRITAVSDIFDGLIEFQMSEREKQKSEKLLLQRIHVETQIEIEVNRLRKQILKDVWKDFDSTVPISISVKFEESPPYQEILDELAKQGWENIFYNPETQVLSFCALKKCVSP